MGEPWSITAMTEQDHQISEIVAEERSRLRNFIRRRVPDPADAEDIVQEVFYELVEANRLLMPIEHVTGWLFRVARNRITDLFRKKKPEPFSDAAVADEDGELLRIEDLLPSPDAGPEALYFRNVLLDELEPAGGVRLAANYLLAGHRTVRSLPDSVRRPGYACLSSLQYAAANKRAHGRALGAHDARGARTVPPELALSLRRL